MTTRCLEVGLAYITLMRKNHWFEMRQSNAHRYNRRVQLFIRSDLLIRKHPPISSQ